MNKDRISRKKAFFGLHFDLHPGKNDTQLGENITEEMIQNLLQKVKPDYVQYDCKGHAGYTGYPTKVGCASPGIKKDSLAIWRKVTKENGVALFIHYSGVWDSVAVEHHPEWACVNADGSVDKNITSTYGPYVDKLLIPQLKEVADTYDLDGVWVDGECWAVKPDFSDTAKKAFTEATSIDKIPTKRSEPHWMEYLEFQRENFRGYLKKYMDALHEHKPGFEITSNWMYSTLAPEVVTVPLDFISGDFSPNDSVNTARLEARYISSTEMPWDLMAWGFNKGENCGFTIKTARQLKQEASVVLGQGGGFQIYYQPTRAGWFDDWMVDIMAEVAQFCRERQAVSHKTKPLPQIAVLLSKNSIYDQSDRLFGPWGSLLAPVEGILHILLELHYSVEVMAEHKLMKNLNKYPVVVLPECHIITDEMKATLLDYIQKGGQLLVIGSETASLFKDSLGVEFTSDPAEITTYVQSDKAMSWLGGVWQSVKLQSAEVLGKRYPTRDSRGEGEPALTLTGIGEGQIAGVYGPVGSVYNRSHYPAIRDFMSKAMKRLLPEPVVELNAPPCVDVSVRTDGKRTLIHLANTAGMQISNKYAVIDFTPSIGPIGLNVRMEKNPQRVYMAPGNDDIDFIWENNQVKLSLPVLDIHSVVVIE
ncbi:hypothetical protein GF312_20345 [Candidatus Poribacteria bacterium]|nr:hypothetical protein [Candidatus Poribacteria bacterium]